MVRSVGRVTPYAEIHLQQVTVYVYIFRCIMYEESPRHAVDKDNGKLCKQTKDKVNGNQGDAGDEPTFDQ